MGAEVTLLTREAMKRLHEPSTEETEPTDPVAQPPVESEVSGNCSDVAKTFTTQEAADLAATTCVAEEGVTYEGYEKSAGNVPELSFAADRYRPTAYGVRIHQDPPKPKTVAATEPTTTTTTSSDVVDTAIGWKSIR